MAISCAVKTCRNHNMNCDLSFYTFPLPRKCSTKELEKLLAMRLAMWRKATGFTRPVHKSVRICGKHFVRGKPSKIDERGDVDWVPSLHLPKQPPSLLENFEAASGRVNRSRRTKQKQICSVKHCESNNQPSFKTKIFPFPKVDTTNYIRRVLSEKRLLIWLELVDKSNSFDKSYNFKLQLCNLHFVSGSMAELTDVENVDWIPTVKMRKRVRIYDHIEHFDLYNLISLVKDTHTAPSFISIDNVSPLRSNDSSENTKVAEKPSESKALFAKPKICVGLKCILCLSTSTLRALRPENRKAIHILFQDKLRAESELICENCSKSVCAFFSFYKTILLNQQTKTIQKLTNMVSVPENTLKRSATTQLPSVPTKKKMHVTNEKGGNLFQRLDTNEFQCKLCQTILKSKPVINDHLFAVHKIKISCKICKISFSPEGYAKHKTGCLAQNKVSKQAPNTNSNETPASNVPQQEVTIPQSIQKHSCYICKEFYSPDEMIAHVKTHGINTGIKEDIVKDYLACKLCQKIILKQNKEKHMKEHETQRNQMKQMICEKQDKRKIKCPVCLKEYRTIAFMERHRLSHKQVNQDDKIECPDCSRVLTAKYYKLHVQIVHDHDLLPCEKCGKQLSRASLKRHRSTTCGDDNMVYCEQCGKVMKEYLLKGHVSKVHPTTTVKCRFCSKEFDSTENCNSHERGAHREELDQRKREGDKRLDLDRDQLEEALVIKQNSNEEESSNTCPVCLNFHGSMSCVEQHVKKAHYDMSMVLGGVVVSSGDNAIEDFNAEEYINEVLRENDQTNVL